MSMQEMVIYGISLDMVGRQPIVLLKTVTDNRFLPIWIGHPEAASIMMRLQGVESPRPGTHDVMVQMLEELEGEVVSVSITELRDKTFFAEVAILDGNGDEHVVDTRPSDALAIAVRVECPILAASEIVEESGVEFEGQGGVDKESMVEEFRQFLDDVDPGDFIDG